MKIENGLEVAKRRIEKKELERAFRIMGIVIILRALIELYEMAGIEITIEQRRKALVEAIKQDDKRHWHTNNM